MVRNVIANEKKTSLHGVYFHVELITFPLVSTCKVSVFGLKIFGQENLCCTNDIFEQNIRNDNFKIGFQEDF